ncbi:MAG: hypothetical protein LQ352_007389 [Teloschistes flavicans]|nr:MAG: hypothetical protein LQ352_007389 [Teloschistes flavicans]
MIRLLNAKTCQLPDNDEKKAQQKQPYVIISHVWGDREIVFEDMPRFKQLSTSSKRVSGAKIAGACEVVLRHYHGAIQYLWLDTVCIDKRDLTELSMSINSMYKWYRQAEACFVYLQDFLPRDDEDEEHAGGFTRSRWFTRGWTLQELIAPRQVIFFDRNWRVIGDKASLQQELSARTKIMGVFLLGTRNISKASVAQRMSWFSGRETTVEEDAAYCLLGIYGVNMPLLYGEGRERAFRRLQEEIMRYSDDHSIFAWTSHAPLKDGSGFLAGSPDYFTSTGMYEHQPDVRTSEPFEMTNKGISIRVFLQQQGSYHVASLDCPLGDSHHVGLYLECRSMATQQYRRVRTDEMCRVRNTGRGEPKRIFIKPPDDI